MVLILMSLTVWLAIWDKENVNCLSRFFYLHKSTMQEFRCQALRANISETSLVPLINEQKGEKE